MKLFSDIIKYGRPKKFFEDEGYSFNTIDLETIDNELFLAGMYNGQYKYTLTDFYTAFNDFFINSVQHNKDILSWSKYDNTFIIKTLIERYSDTEKRWILTKIGKVTPLFTYQYRSFTIEVTNAIKENIIFTITDMEGHKKRLTLYNLKNLFKDDGLESVAEDYKIDFYSKMGVEYHVIDRKRFDTDTLYRKGVIESNRLDNVVLIDIAKQLLDNFMKIAGIYPKTMYTAGSLARSYLLTLENINFNFKAIFGKKKEYDRLLDYAMKSYHGGKIESYILGYVESAKIIDITSAYPYALSRLPKLTGKIFCGKDPKLLKGYFYAFINCTIYDIPDMLIHPVTIPSIINSTNISPSGTFTATITKVEYDYLISKGVKVEVNDYIAVESTDEYPFYGMITELFQKRMESKKTNPSISGLYKLILNSLYGITYELTDVYDEDDEEITWKGYRAGDFFNPIYASYITAMTRTYLSEVGQNILDNGGKVYLNMTDSIIYDGKVTLDVISDTKILGKFEKPETIKDVIILGAGRYEYYNEFTKKYTIKSRGFSVKLKSKSFYKELDLDETVEIKHKTLVTFYKSTTNKYKLSQLGHLIEDNYVINPLNLGGKRIINDLTVNLKKEYTTTRPVRLGGSLR